MEGGTLCLPAAGGEALKQRRIVESLRKKELVCNYKFLHSSRPQLCCRGGRGFFKATRSSIKSAGEPGVPC